jgi:hypothetical protein
MQELPVVSDLAGKLAARLGQSFFGRCNATLHFPNQHGPIVIPILMKPASHKGFAQVINAAIKVTAVYSEGLDDIVSMPGIRPHKFLPFLRS